ncbi:MAG: peroxide stress protein YaaA [Candidatus Nanopelagicales bacterium]|nr:peroxide stress protein YaaA [Candidatus Nanopelagicales bacterium]
MLVLLPPSEGKTAPVEGSLLDLAALSLPALNPARRTVLRSLVGLCRSTPAEALEVLGLSVGQAGEVQRNRELRRAITAPAWQVYTGVLFSALDVEGADPAVRSRLEEWVLVWSGLWGAVRLTDPIPAYRLSGAVTLPGPGRLASFWREPLRKALGGPSRDGLVLDLRSGTYAASWTGPPERTAAIRVIHQQRDRRTVASHLNKATKGRLLKALAQSPDGAQTVDELVDAIRAAGFRVEPGAPSGGGRTSTPRTLDVVVDSL